MASYIQTAFERWAYVQAEQPVPLRLEASTNGKALVLILPNTKVRVRGVAVGGWHRIFVGDRAVGYLSGYVPASVVPG